MEVVMRNRMILFFSLVLLISQQALGFVVTGNRRSVVSSSKRLTEDNQEIIFGNSELEDIASTPDSSFFNSLQNRQKELKEGVGKRYVTRTQKGFLNVHYEPSDPFDSSNVVNQLKEGQVVTSTGPSRGFWIPHDGGGWSISKYGAFTWLEPVDE